MVIGGGEMRKIACSRRSDISPRFFPALSLALFFARAPLSERLEQAMRKIPPPLPYGGANTLGTRKRNVSLLSCAGES